MIPALSTESLDSNGSQDSLSPKGMKSPESLHTWRFAEPMSARVAGENSPVVKPHPPKDRPAKSSPSRNCSSFVVPLLPLLPSLPEAYCEYDSGNEIGSQVSERGDVTDADVEASLPASSSYFCRAISEPSSPIRGPMPERAAQHGLRGNIRKLPRLWASESSPLGGWS